MSEEEKEELKVRDKRRFSADTGELRKDAPPAPEPKQAAPPPQEKIKKEEIKKEEVKKDEPKSEPAPGKAEGPIPEATFAGLVMNFASQAMAFMGAVPEAREEMNLPIAKHLIETLEVIQTKTKGNLDKEEEQLLTNALYQLHMMFVEISKKK